MSKVFDWTERDTKEVAQQGVHLANTRNNWRKATITADEITGSIVVAYAMPNGEPDVKHYTRTGFAKHAVDIAWSIAAHVTP